MHRLRLLRAARTLVLALLVLPWHGGATDFAHEATIAEYRLKAAFLYNFAKFVEWPEGAFDASEPWRLCVFGPDVHAIVRDTLAGKTVKGRPLEVRAIAGVGDASRCRLVFVSVQARPPLRALLDGLGDTVLKVGETPDFLRDGGAINLVRHDNRIRFEVRRQAARTTAGGLQLSSQLLKLAVLVDDND